MIFPGHTRNPTCEKNIAISTAITPIDPYAASAIPPIGLYRKIVKKKKKVFKFILRFLKEKKEEKEQYSKNNKVLNVECRNYVLFRLLM